MDIDDKALAAIELCRKINRSAASQYAQRGIEQADIAIAAIYSAHDAARELHAGDAHAAIEYQRTALDLMERQLLARAAEA